MFTAPEWVEILASWGAKPYFGKATPRCNLIQESALVIFLMFQVFYCSEPPSGFWMDWVLLCALCEEVLIFWSCLHAPTVKASACVHFVHPSPFGICTLTSGLVGGAIDCMTTLSKPGKLGKGRTLSKMEKPTEMAISFSSVKVQGKYEQIKQANKEILQWLSEKDVLWERSGHFWCLRNCEQWSPLIHDQKYAHTVAEAVLFRLSLSVAIFPFVTTKKNGAWRRPRWFQLYKHFNARHAPNTHNLRDHISKIAFFIPTKNQ